MAAFVVKCGYRLAGLYPTQTTYSTHFHTVTVEAEGPNEARLAAIDACYANAELGDIEHVQPRIIHTIHTEGE